MRQTGRQAIREAAADNRMNESEIVGLIVDLALIHTLYFSEAWDYVVA